VKSYNIASFSISLKMKMARKMPMSYQGFAISTISIIIHGQSTLMFRPKAATHGELLHSIQRNHLNEDSRKNEAGSSKQRWLTRFISVARQSPYLQPVSFLYQLTSCRALMIISKEISCRRIRDSTGQLLAVPNRLLGVGASMTCGADEHKGW